MRLLDRVTKLFSSQPTQAKPSVSRNTGLNVDAVFANNVTVIGAECDNDVYVDCESDTLKGIMKEYGYEPTPSGISCSAPTVSLTQIACGAEYYANNHNVNEDDTDYIFLTQCHVQQTSIPPFILGNITANIAQSCKAAEKAQEATALKTDEIVGGVLGGIAFIAAILGCIYYRRNRLTSANASPQSRSRAALLTAQRRVNGVDHKGMESGNTHYLSMTSTA